MTNIEQQWDEYLKNNPVLDVINYTCNDVLLRGRDLYKQVFIAGSKATERGRIEHLEKALDEIANPIKYMQQRAKEAGCSLDGQYAVMISKDPYFLQDIAKKALGNYSPSQPH